MITLEPKYYETFKDGYSMSENMIYIRTISTQCRGGCQEMLVEFSYICDSTLLKAVLGLVGVERLTMWVSSMPWSFLGRWFEISSVSRSSICSM